MSKPKAFLKHGKSKPKRKEQILETADDFQAAGVDFSEAAGKWRAGDAGKSMRFFQRAIDVYDQGLRIFPQSSDLAYNKGQVLLEIATHPILIKQLQVPLINALEQALTAHQYALTLEPNDANTLFNTAQVLTSIAEEIAKDETRQDHDALPLLEQALDLQARCLSIQELQYEQEEVDKQQLLTANDDDAPSDSRSGEAEEDQNKTANPRAPVPATEDQWFAIVEPTTIETLIDSVLVQFATLTIMCGMLTSSIGSATNPNLAWIEEYTTKLSQTKLELFSKTASAEKLQETAVAKARLMSAMLDAGYRMGSIDPRTFKAERDAAFNRAELNLEHSFDALVLNAESLMAYNLALWEREDSGTVETSSRWNALSAAIATLATASKLPSISPQDVARTHFLRGDCSLLQLQMREPPISYPNAASNAAQLVKNAEVFYRNASKLDPDGDVSAVAAWRSFIASKLTSQSSLSDAFPQDFLGRGSEWVLRQSRIMQEEGLLSSVI